MKPSIRVLGEILHSLSQYVIPVFQRNYRWEAGQWEKLWESLLEIRDPSKRGNHFMGFLVFVPEQAQPGQHTRFHLIDGQQRLTTCSILLAALRNAARAAGQADLASEIHDDYLVHPRKARDEHYRLLPKERDHDSYVALVSGEGRPTGRMADALAYFEGRVTEFAEGKPELLREFFHTVGQRLEFMCATLEAESAFNIFKSLNSTGVPLGPADLIRNFVFMHVPPAEQDDFDHVHWRPLENRFAREDGTLDEKQFSRFFRDFLMAGGRYVSPTETFPAFEARYEATDFAPKELATEVNRAAGHYDVISGRQADEDPPVTRALIGLNKLDSSTTYPVLLALFARRAQGALTSEQLAECIEMLRGFILRRFICGESSRGYGQMFVRALTKDQGTPVESLRTFLLERGWPDDRRFIGAFVQFPLYERGYAREVLEALELDRGHKEQADLTAAQIEHVLPQTLNADWSAVLGPDAALVQAEWLHRPGNLTLSAYNQEMQNHAFPIKRVRFAESNIVITRELAQCDQWGPDQIRDRGAKLATAAARIWTGPAEPVAAVIEAIEDARDGDEAPGRKELRVRFWRRLQGLVAAEYPSLPAIEARPTYTIRLPSRVRNVGLDLRFGLQARVAAIDIYFWREESFRAWERVNASPAEFDGLLGSRWTIDRYPDKAQGWMSATLECEDLRDEARWGEIHQWMARSLVAIYEKVLPRLRQLLDA